MHIYNSIFAKVKQTTQIKVIICRFFWLSFSITVTRFTMCIRFIRSDSLSISMEGGQKQFVCPILRTTVVPSSQEQTCICKEFFTVAGKKYLCCQTFLNSQFWKLMPFLFFSFVLVFTFNFFIHAARRVFPRFKFGQHVTKVSRPLVYSNYNSKYSTEELRTIL